MITPTDVTTQEYTNAIYNGNQQFVKVKFLTQNRIFREKDISADGGVTVSTYSNASENVKVGNVFTTEVTIQFIVSSTNKALFDGLDWTQEFELSFGVEVDEPEKPRWVTIGYFSGKKPKMNILNNVITFTATDRTNKFNDIADTFVSSESQRRLGQIFLDVCTDLGLEGVFAGDAGHNPELFTNFSFIDTIIPNGTTYRQLLSWIAEASGRFVYARNDGKIVLGAWVDYLSSPVEIITSSKYYDLQIEGDSISAKDCVLASSTTSDFSYLYPTSGTNPYKVVDNPFIVNATQANANIMINSIVANLTAYGSYTPVSMECICNWLLEPSDKIQINYTYQGNSNSIIETINNRVMTWNGTCTVRYEFAGSEDNDDFLTPEMKEQYKNGGMFATKKELSAFDSSLSNISVFQGGSSAVAANNNTYSFELPLRSHAIVAIAIGLVSFFNYGVLGYTDLPSGFSATMDENNIVTINRSSNTKFAIHGILFTPAW